MHSARYWLWSLIISMLALPVLGQNIPPIPRADEFILGPFTQVQVHQNVAVNLKIWVLVALNITDEEVGLRARFVGDLQDLQSKTEELADKLPLPTVTCNRLGIETKDEKITIQGTSAILGFRGGVRAKICPFNDGPFEPLRASLPFSMRVISDGQQIQLAPGKPEINGGLLFEVVGLILKINGFDMTREVQKLLEGAIQPVGFKDFLAEDLRDLEPRFTAARFFDAGGNRLAAEVEMQVILDREALRKGEIRAAGD